MRTMAYGVFTDEDRQRAREIQDLHARFVTRQVATGNDSAVPAGRPDPSDFNVSAPDMLADGTDLDRYFAAADRIMGVITLTAAAPQAQTGAMVAFVPSAADCSRLAMNGCELPTDLHMTAAYLGEAVDWAPAQREQVLSAVSAAASGMAPIEADGFAVSMFNPKGDQPAIVMGISG